MPRQYILEKTPSSGIDAILIVLTEGDNASTYRVGRDGGVWVKTTELGFFTMGWYLLDIHSKNLILAETKSITHEISANSSLE